MTDAVNTDHTHQAIAAAVLGVARIINGELCNDRCSEY
jgi:hypothetical protein